MADVNKVHSIHYLDKYDLLDQMENEKIDEIRSFIKEILILIMKLFLKISYEKQWNL